MGKIREVFQKMSLKRSLVLLAVFCLSLVSALSVITILTCSSIQKKILDTRPIIITDYVIRDADSNDTENNNGWKERGSGNSHISGKSTPAGHYGDSCYLLCKRN